MGKDGCMTIFVWIWGILSDLYSTIVIFPYLFANIYILCIIEAIYQIIFIFSIVSYARTVYSNPGFVDNDYQPSSTVVKHPKEELITTEASFYKATWCKHCNNWRPPRAHHCSICDRCVLKMDHHCPWVDNCVGLRNEKFFFLFLIYSFLHQGLGFLVNLIVIIKNFNSNQSNPFAFVSLIMVWFLFMFCFVSGSMLISFTMNSCTNVTTIEDRTAFVLNQTLMNAPENTEYQINSIGYLHNTSEFPLGKGKCCFNLKLVLGNVICKLLLPSHIKRTETLPWDIITQDKKDISLTSLNSSQQSKIIAIDI
eukprot:TRINITY_DN2914_c0_g1_i1.p1 TRINITY_DN2914_c0_g1~~TRINITY_DN2914_c0_g1_i1.p1  ORF type:complete len:310 (+),score=32.79 TRINITY_DN2914_c0_g1_i1:77-1006(+)